MRFVRRLLPVLASVAAALALPPATAPTPGFPYGAPALSADAKARLDGRHPRGVRPGTSVAARAATLAVRMVGTPYRWGGESPAGFDCSGLIRWAYLQLGVDLPHSSYALYATGEAVPRSEMRTGDVLVFTGLGHVGLYLGGRKMVHAPYSGKHVELVDLAETSYGARLVGVRRVVGD